MAFTFMEGFDRYGIWPIIEFHDNDPCDDWSSVYDGTLHFYPIERRPAIALDNDPCDAIHPLSWQMHSLMGKWGSPTGRFHKGELAPLAIIPGYHGHKTNLALSMLARMYPDRLRDMLFTPSIDIEAHRVHDGVIVIDSFPDDLYKISDPIFIDEAHYQGPHRRAAARLIEEELRALKPQADIRPVGYYDRDANPRSMKDTRRIMGRGGKGRRQGKFK